MDRCNAGEYKGGLNYVFHIIFLHLILIVQKNISHLQKYRDISDNIKKYIEFWDISNLVRILRRIQDIQTYFYQSFQNLDNIGYCFDF